MLPRVAYRLALTQDQVEVLKLLESLYEKVEDSKIAIVVTADRGRGKSSVIGIGMGALAHKLRRTKGRCRIIVTAPSETNVQELLRFSRVTLERLNHKVEVVEEEGHKSRGRYLYCRLSLEHPSRKRMTMMMAVPVS